MEPNAARMEPNLHFWISERPSFVQRFLLWTELLDPENLIISSEAIEQSRQLLSANTATRDVEDKKIQEAWKMSLSTVHPDSGKLIPAPFRPAAFLPFMGPLVFFSMMPLKGWMTVILPQLSLYAYLTPFNIMNGNTRHDRQRENLVLGAGVVASSTFFGTLPHLAQQKLSRGNPALGFVVRRVFPVVVLAQVSALNVFTSRSSELAQGIKVMDREGNVIGNSRRAGDKAIKETALSRMVLFGTSACVPEVAAYFFKRSRFFLQHAQSLWTVKLASGILAMGLMVPVSFSMFPQVRQIQHSELEAEIQAATPDTDLFYNRGV